MPFAWPASLQLVGVVASRCALRYERSLPFLVGAVYLVRLSRTSLDTQQVLRRTRDETAMLTGFLAMRGPSMPLICKKL